MCYGDDVEINNNKNEIFEKKIINKKCLNHIVKNVLKKLDY